MERINQKTTASEDAYSYWLYTIEGIGTKKRRALLELFGNARAIYEIKEEKIDELSFLNRKDKERVKLAKQNTDIQKGFEELEKRQMKFVMQHHSGYPERLLKTPDAPFGLFVSGRLPSGDRPSVAVVGARECSEYGRYVATELGRRLALSGIQVVSGLARGIDSIAQKAAQKAGGEVFGVLGCGVDICYPGENRALYEKLKQTGGILSEYPPGTQPKAGLFPRRNRIISGLADALVVVEAREKSGTLITVDMALEQGKEVYVIPGRVTDPLSCGCNKLIRQGAAMLTNLTEFVREIEALFQRQKAESKESVQKENKSKNNTAAKQDINADKMESGSTDVLLNDSCPALQRAIIKSIYIQPQSLQQIYTSLSLSQELELFELVEALFCMEEKGLICLTDGYYRLTPTGRL